MEVKIKKLVENAVVPQYAHDTDAGLDLTAVSKEVDEYGNIVYHTGLAIEIPEGYAGFLFPRSSVSKYNLSLCNCVGVIDSAYRGEIILKFNEVIDYYATGRKVNCKYKEEYNVGDRVAQLIILPYPKIKLVETDELSDSDRGEGGFGSTGV
jgi:dUTP pyrophosphatase